MVTITGMTKSDLLKLDPKAVGCLSEKDFLYMAQTLGALWQYNYSAAEKGRVGMHAILKSGLHSDAFFISRILLEPSNIRWFLAEQLVLRLKKEGVPKPDWIVGIPDGATKLGEDVAKILNAKNVKMKKENDKIMIVSPIDIEGSLLVIEDFCTRGTGFREVFEILSKQPKARLLRFEGVILNRGGLSYIHVDDRQLCRHFFKIVPVVEHKINDWQPEDCPLCRKGSTTIKPKATDENWRLITTSQQ